MVYRETVDRNVVRLTGKTGGTDGAPGANGLTPSLRGLSITNWTIGTGSKTFVISPAMNVAFPVGSFVRAQGASSLNWMAGLVTAATTTSVTINVLEIGGSGTYASWTLTLSANQGATGAQGTRWGTTPIWIFGPTSGATVSFADGLPPRVGDYVISTNGFDVGNVSVVTGVVDTTHADCTPAGFTVRGEEGPPGTTVNWPVDSVYLSFSSTNPATIFGGTWMNIGQGRMIVGVDTLDTDWDVAGETGGAKTVTLSETQVPDHKHYPGTLDTGSAGGHSHTLTRKAGIGTNTGMVRGNNVGEADATTSSDGGHTHSIGGQTGVTVGTNNQPHNNLPPYIAVFMWRRVA